MLAKIIATAGLLAATATGAAAATVTFSDTELATGPVVTDDGVTLTATAAVGSIGTIGSGTYTGLHIGGISASGSYTLGFSEAITSIQIEFDALSSTGSLPVETLFGFATNLGSVSVGYLNQFGTTFDGSTISSTANDGQGIISYSGAAFTSFSFSHNQGVQAGFVLENIVVTTADISSVPLPAGGLLLLSGLGGVAALKRRKKKRAAA